MAWRLLTIPGRSLITDDTPLWLAVAAEIAFSSGGMSVSGRRKERDAGRLVTELATARGFTTLADITCLREICGGELKRPQLGRANQMPAFDPERSKRVLAALSLTLERLRMADPKSRGPNERPDKKLNVIRAKRAVRPRVAVKLKHPSKA